MKKLLVMIAMMFAWCMPAVADDEMPKDALWTIYCSSYSGPMKVEQAKSAKDALIKSTGMKYWHVIHLNDESTLYYGFYRGVSPESEEAKMRKDAQRAEEDLKKIKAMVDADNNKVFAMIGFVPLPQPGGEGPPEWDLLNLPADKYWTLFVGVYKDNPDRKKAAVQAVKTLREEGKEAYYMHDATASMICIGAWPRSSIKDQQTGDATASLDEPDTEVMSVNVPLPRNVPREFVTPEGKKVKVSAPSVDVNDPSLQSAMDRYPDFLTNGQWLGREVRDKATGKTKVIGHRSQLFIIPRREAKGTKTTNREAEEAVRQLKPGVTKQPAGTGTLKSLED